MNPFRRFIVLFIIILSGILLIAACFGIKRRYINSPIAITEICGSNEAVSYDDEGDYGSDYIELYNSSDSTVDLDGWGLTDDPLELYKFTFHNKQIAPGEAIIIWCDDKIIDESEYKDDYVVKDVHNVPFNLSRGEYCILTDGAGKCMSSVLLPYTIPSDKVYSSTLRQLWGEYEITHPTPYYVEEITSDETYYICLEEPDFSMEGGFYDDPITIEMEAHGGTIYYTLNGVDPTEESEIYRGPIEITNRSYEPNIYSAIGDISLENEYLPDFNVDKCTVLKAVVIDGDKRSPIKTESYMVGLTGPEYDKIPTISISMSPLDLFGAHDGIYPLGEVNVIHQAKTGEQDGYGWANFSKRGRGWEREAELEYFYRNQSKEFEQKIGIRIHGGGSREYNQKSFSLYARSEYDGNDAFVFDPFTGNTGNNICNKLVLRSGGEVEMYYTKLRDVLFQILASDRDIGTQKAIPCNVFLNGEYWGLYNLQEKASECYIEEYYGVLPDDQILIKKNIIIDNGEENAFDEVIKYAEDNDLSKQECYEEIERMIDIQSMIDYYSVEFFSGNPDSFANNLGIWRSISSEGKGYDDGRWRWLLFDLDDGAALKSEESSAWVDSFIEGNYWGERCPIKDDVLFAALIKNSEFKRRFVTSFMDLINENFRYERTALVLRSLADLYREADIKSQQRFRGDNTDEAYFPDSEFTYPYSDEDFERDINVIDEFLKERGEYMTEYLGRDMGLKGEKRKISISKDSSADVSVFVNTLNLDSNYDTWEGEYYSDYPVELNCSVGDGCSFAGWEVNGELIVEKELELILNNPITEIRVITK